MNTIARRLLDVELGQSICCRRHRSLILRFDHLVDQSIFGRTNRYASVWAGDLSHPWQEKRAYGSKHRDTAYSRQVPPYTFSTVTFFTTTSLFGLSWRLRGTSEIFVTIS